MSPDAFVAKLNADGTALIYSTFLGGVDGFNFGHSVATDGSGNAYVTGTTNATDFPTTPGAFDTVLTAGSKAFVSKLNASGTAFIYSTLLGGQFDNTGFSIAVDASGSAYVTGETLADDFPTTPGAFQITLQGQRDAFVTKLNADGTALVYSTYLGVPFYAAPNEYPMQPIINNILAKSNAPMLREWRSAGNNLVNIWNAVSLFSLEMIPISDNIHATLSSYSNVKIKEAVDQGCALFNGLWASVFIVQPIN
ncbi:SBBP repeat-containing protein [Paenibacillus sp. CECT 9249]|uniref:SBBP repeat-containing protein n=1 Tax=unclassified Paenibacillus TaxID=185978 RepID=UPI001C101EE0|nr:SBBP repeat-containing protein [Paenibacillus sp. CECT 9249]MBU5445037.1 SBBP repeat-containing protein [Paenibacillus sp. MSJ-34]CAH0122643.1 hypothetical protein PAE9249_05215 [Paenibacillus sp. CECT 9249]